MLTQRIVGAPSIFNNLEEVALNVLSYICAKENRKILITKIEEISNQITPQFLSSWRLSERAAEIQKLLAELKRIAPLKEDGYWLELVVKFFYTDPDIKKDVLKKREWDSEYSPNMRLMRAILDKFKKYDQKQLLPAGAIAKKLYELFYNSACTQAREYQLAQEKHVQQLKELQEIKRNKAVKESVVDKFYKAPERRKINFEDNPDLKQVQERLLKLYSH